ncbi:MAG: Dabb family protein [Phycisphaerae bacterium]
MRKTTTLGTVLFTGLLVAAAGCAEKAGGTRTAGSGVTAAPGKLLRHVVLFKFKDGTSTGQIKAVEDAFRALPGKINVIRDFEWGTDISPEHKSQGFTHCFLLTFRTEADRDAYLPHPAHKEFGRMLGPVLDKVLVVDYWARR